MLRCLEILNTDTEESHLQRESRTCGDSAVPLDTFLHSPTSYHSEGVSKIFSEIKDIYSISFMQRKPNIYCKSIGKRVELHLN